MLYKRRLPGSGMSDQSDKLSVRYHKIDVRQCLKGNTCSFLIYMIHMIQNNRHAVPLSSIINTPSIRCVDFTLYKWSASISSSFVRIPSGISSPFSLSSCASIVTCGTSSRSSFSFSTWLKISLGVPCRAIFP